MHRQLAGQVALQPSSPIPTVATQLAASITVQDRGDTAWGPDGASKHQKLAALQAVAQLPARDELGKLALAGCGAEGPASRIQPCMHTVAGHVAAGPEWMHAPAGYGAERPASGVQPCMHAPMAALKPQVKAMQPPVVQIVKTVDSTSLDALQLQVEPATSISTAFTGTTGPAPLQTMTSSFEPVVEIVGEGVATPPSSPSPVVEQAPQPPMGMTPTRRSSRHSVADDGSMDTDEDSLVKAMRRKAAQNLDNQGITSSPKSFLDFSNTTIVSKLNKVGVSLGKNEKDISISTNALKHLGYDRLKVTPHVSTTCYSPRARSAGADVGSER